MCERARLMGQLPPPDEGKLIIACMDALKAFFVFPGAGERKRLDAELEAFQRAWMEGRR